ncbi:Protein yippee-like 3 [Colletotrichum sp. SAR11_59]|nr:Protein yippee-like 3 [Colletotrichum sp. SAR11_240]KAI8297465.1 Protein yippee-like 3 [Colletotrichum sp. SAR11_59]
MKISSAGQPYEREDKQDPSPSPLIFLSQPALTAKCPYDQNFRGQHGKAYLFNTVVNIETGEPSERNMTTGRHIVRDITCKQCKETVGWKYDKAYEATEKYKEGKFILEAELLCNVT